MTTVTQWFVIDVDGQPDKVGWWGAKYAGSAGSTRWWWDGRSWRTEPGGRATTFGNELTAGERWRGLAVKPKSGIKST